MRWDLLSDQEEAQEGTGGHRNDLAAGMHAFIALLVLCQRALEPVYDAQRLPWLVEAAACVAMHDATINSSALPCSRTRWQAFVTCTPYVSVSGSALTMPEDKVKCHWVLQTGRGASLALLEAGCSYVTRRRCRQSCCRAQANI